MTRSTDIARGLATLVGPGDAVATASLPGPDAVSVTTALSLLGAVELALPDEISPQLARQLAHAVGCVLTLAAPARIAREPVLAELGRHPRVPVVAVGDTPGTVPLEALIAEPTALPRHKPGLGTPALVMPTSGTTGRPKGALLPNGAGLAQASRVREAMAYGPDDVLFNFFSWQHINARHAAFLPAVLAGARLVIEPRFSASRLWETAAAESVTAFNFMGAVCAILLRRPEGPGDRAHMVTRAYGGPAPAWMVRDMASRFGVQLRQAYACTELGDVATSGSRIRPGAAGRLVRDYDVRVNDEAGCRVPDGEAGELVVRPRAAHLTFTGYVGDPGATAAAWRDGWFHTGDRGRIEDGWLWFEGRSADVIRRRGINISAAEVENAVASLPAVAEVAAVGVPSELTEDEVMVVVIPAPGTELDPAAVHRGCQTVLPRHSVPRYVSVESVLPRNSSMKLLRHKLRARGLPASVWDAENPSCKEVQ
jgi:carnitine-CoA ligase